MQLENRVALVTGASGGLGAGICEAFAREGADCMVAYRSDPAEAERTAAKVRAAGRRAETVAADIGDEASVLAMLAAVERTFGRLDILVANAGLGSGGHLLETKLADFERVIRTNLIGTYLTVRHGAPLMVRQRRGKIITVSSIHGLGGTHHCSLYEATKAGIINFTRGAAFDLAEHNIQVNCIAPGAVPVPKDPPPPEDSEMYRAWMRYTPLGRFGTPEDVAGVAVFLASSASDWMTGQVISIDGGISAGHLLPSFKHYGGRPKAEPAPRTGAA
jgi:NAD(P)-dependent dehydrogenase (short-subunit alcohol dehydrogenase family)